MEAGSWKLEDGEGTGSRQDAKAQRKRLTCLAALRLCASALLLAGTAGGAMRSPLPARVDGFGLAWDPSLDTNAVGYLVYTSNGVTGGLGWFDTGTNLVCYLSAGTESDSNGTRRVWTAGFQGWSNGVLTVGSAWATNEWLKPGEGWSFWVTAYDAEGMESENSNVLEMQVRRRGEIERRRVGVMRVGR